MVSTTRTMEVIVDTEEYNGWKNRETWAASLHLNNDEGLYLMVDGWARDVAGEESATRILADMIEEFVSDLFADSPGNEHVSMMRSDVGSLWRVDWFGVADGFLAEHKPAEDFIPVPLHPALQWK